MSRIILPAALSVCIAMAASALFAPAGFGQTPPAAADPATGLPRADRPVEESPARQETQAAGEPRAAADLQPARTAPAAGEPRVAAPVPRPAPDTAVSIDFEEELLDDRLAILERRLTETLSRVDSLLMTLEIEVLKVQKDTLARRRELATVSTELSEQQRLTAQDIRNKERLVDLVERYGAGDWVARHLKVELEKFRHRTQRNPGLSADQEPLGRRLREYRQTLFELGTLLFRVDAEAGDYARALVAEGQPSPAVRSRLDSLVEDRKEALQAQERVLSELADRAARLLDLKRRREDQLQSLFTLVLDRMLWLRNREPLGLFPPNWALFGQAVDGGVGLLTRVYGWLLRERQMAEIRFTGSSWPWAAAVLVFGVMPWLAVRASRFLRGRLTRHRARGPEVPAHRVALLLAVRAAVWPVYIVLAVLALPQLGLSQNDSLGPALAGALQLAALVLWAGLFGEAVFRADGHGERRWGVAPEAGRWLRGAVLAVCVAAFVLLIPRYVLLNAPGDDVGASLALARLLMIAFAWWCWRWPRSVAAAEAR